jgi:hypothetical protein
MVGAKHPQGPPEASYPAERRREMYKKLVLKNDYHNTQVTLRVEHNGKIEIDDVIELTAGQIKKTQKLLCGIAECLCAGDLGTRGNWHDLDGEEVKLQEEIFYNNRTGKPEYAKLYIEKIW